MTPKENSGFPFSIESAVFEVERDAVEAGVAVETPNENPAPLEVDFPEGGTHPASEDTPNLKAPSLDLAELPKEKFPVRTFELSTAEPGLRDSHARHFVLGALLLTMHTSHSQSPGAFLNLFPNPCIGPAVKAEALLGRPALTA